MTSGTSIQPRLEPISALVNDFMAGSERRWDAQQNGTQLGPMTGFRALDTALGGCLAPGLHILHGSPGTGKTALLWQMAAHCGVPAVFVTCELSPLELLARAIARETRTFLGDIKSGLVLPTILHRHAYKTIEELSHVYLVDATTEWPNRQFLIDAAEIARGGGPHVLMLLDSVHTWAQGLVGNVSEYEALSAAVDSLRRVAAQVNMPLLGIAERNRSSMDRGGLSASAGSRKFEYAAEAVIELSRPDEAEARSKRPVMEGTDDSYTDVQVKLSKNRHGSVGRVINLTFEGRVQCFTEVPY